VTILHKKTFIYLEISAYISNFEIVVKILIYMSKFQDKLTKEHLRLAGQLLLARRDD